MFFPGSRYEKMPQYTVTRSDGTVIAATRLPLPVSDPVIGYHRRQLGQRLYLDRLALPRGRHYLLAIV